MNIRPRAIQVIPPDPRFTHGIWATKFTGNLRGFDYSFSYYHGYEDIPVLTEVKLVQPETPPAQQMGAQQMGVDALLQLGYPPLDVVGLDLAGEWFGVGVWMEAGLFLPENRDFTITGFDSEPTLPPALFLDDRRYLKYTVGLDYTFRKLGYVNVQWMHGFFTERGRDNLHDYLFLRWERKGFQERVKLILGVVLESTRLGSKEAATGFALLPEIQLNPVDSLEIRVGSFYLGGDAPTLLGQWKDFDQGVMQVKVTF